MTWSLASYTANGATGFGVLREDGTLVAPADLKRWSSTLNLLEDWPAAEVAAGADVLLSIVPTAEDVEEIIEGPAGTLTALKPGTIHIEMSTIDVDRKARLRDQVRAKGGDLLDCRSPAAPAWSPRGWPPPSPRARRTASTG